MQSRLVKTEPIDLWTFVIPFPSVSTFDVLRQRMISCSFEASFFISFVYSFLSSNVLTCCRIDSAALELSSRETSEIRIACSTESTNKWPCIAVISFSCWEDGGGSVLGASTGSRTCLSLNPPLYRQLYQGSSSWCRILRVLEHYLRAYSLECSNNFIILKMWKDSIRRESFLAC